MSVKFLHMKKIDKDHDLIHVRAARLRQAREAAGYLKRPPLFERYPSWKSSTYTSHELGLRGFDEEDAKRYAEAFKVTPGYLLAHDIVDEKPANTRQPKPNASFPPRWQAFSGETSVPVLGQTTAGPNGRFILNGSEVGRVFMPPMLEGVEGAYAVRVYGTSMEPRFEAGETVWLNPNEPVRQGDDVVVQLVTDEEHGRESYIKKYISKNSKVIRLLQHNPEEGETKELELDARRVFAVHKVVFHAML